MAPEYFIDLPHISAGYVPIQARRDAPDLTQSRLGVLHDDGQLRRADDHALCGRSQIVGRKLTPERLVHPGFHGRRGL
jgi:hypothetical protein